MLAAIGSGFAADPYLEHVRRIPPPHPYALNAVLLVVGMMTLQIAVLVFVLRPGAWPVSWRRAAVVLVFCMIFLAFGTFISMHAPPPIGVYAMWLMGMGGGAFLLLMRACWLRWRMRFR